MCNDMYACIYTHIQKQMNVPIKSLIVPFLKWKVQFLKDTGPDSVPPIRHVSGLRCLSIYSIPHCLYLRHTINAKHGWVLLIAAFL